MWNPRPSPFTPSALHVLVVEDDTITARGLALLLEREGYAVEIAPDGVAALRLAETGVFDLLVCDDVLPDCDSASLIPRLTQSGRVPVISVSASAVAAGAEGTPACVARFRKPLDVAGFLAAVRRVVRPMRPRRGHPRDAGATRAAGHARPLG